MLPPAEIAAAHSAKVAELAAEPFDFGVSGGAAAHQQWLEPTVSEEDVGMFQSFTGVDTEAARTYLGLSGGSVDGYVLTRNSNSTYQHPGVSCFV